MSEQIPSILVTSTVFDTTEAIYSNDLTKTKNMTLQNTKTCKKMKNITKTKKHWKNRKKHKNMFLYFYEKHKKCFYIYGSDQLCRSVHASKR